ncbi:MAG: translesion error-prone DNA polymerase V autoproteolytic subunit [Bacteroidota bacterium]|nr:translesion error-prone DNA polymerase V autoproteolytic subunit [Bacteroidota bacterium]
MNEEYFSEAAYKGSKEFTQWDVQTANATGFGAAADDYAERGIDLNEQLIKNKPATFFFRMSGDAMTSAGIHNGDTLIVDRSLKIANGKVVVVVLNGEMIVRRFEKTFNKIRLVPETKKLATIDVDLNGCEFSIWGVVTYVIHAV